MTATMTSNGKTTEMVTVMPELDAEEIAELQEILELDQRRAHLTEPEPEKVRSIFEGRTSAFTRYRVELTFREKVLGGTPSNPKILADHISAKAGVSDEAVKQKLLASSLAERLGIDAANSASLDEILAAAEDVASTHNTNGFRRDPKKGLFLPGRYAKAMIKECTNIAFAGERWGVTKKGPKNFISERAFVEESCDRLYLGRMKPDGVELIIGHVSGPQGPQSTLAHHEYVLQASTSFAIKSFKDSVTMDQWFTILELAENIGLGACRSQGHGRFAVTAFDKLKPGQEA